MALEMAKANSTAQKLHNDSLSTKVMYQNVVPVLTRKLS